MLPKALPSMASLTHKPTSPFWFACYRDHTGRQCRRSTHERNERRAQRIADLMEQVAKRKLNALRIREAVNEIYREVSGESLPQASVAAYAGAWLAQKKLECKASTYEHYEKGINKFLAFLGERSNADLNEIEKRSIVAFRDSLIPKVAIKTANHDSKTIKMLFRAARRDGYIDVDPAEFVPALKRDLNASSRRPFTLPEIRQVLEVADEEWQLLILFGLYTGQRIGDLAAMTWSNLDLGRNEISFITRKRGKRLVIPLAVPLREHILNHLPKSDAPDAAVHPRAFATLKKDKRVRHLSAQFGDLLAAAGLRPKLPHSSRGIGRNARRGTLELSFHCLRHTAVSLLRDAQVPEAAVMELVGHDSVEISRRYTHVGREALSKAVEALPTL
jgi:integrase